MLVTYILIERYDMKRQIPDSAKRLREEKFRDS